MEKLRYTASKPFRNKYIVAIAHVITHSTELNKQGFLFTVTSLKD